MTKFDAKTFDVSSEIYNKISANQVSIEGDKDTSKEALARVKTAKLDNIVQLVVGLAAVPLTAKDNLPTTVSSKVKQKLQEQALMTKGMSENMVKYVARTRAKWNIGGDNVTPEMVYEIFANHYVTLESGVKQEAPIDSEKKLVDALYGNGAAKSDVTKAVEQIVGKRSKKSDGKGGHVDGDAWLGGMSWDDIDGLFGVGVGGELPQTGPIADAIAVRRDIEEAKRNAGQEAGDKAQADADAINEMVEQFAEAS